MSEAQGKATIYLIAGEASGDLLASGLMKAIKAEVEGRVSFLGIGGPLMEEEGLAPLFPMKELSVMGLAEVLPHIPRLLKRIRQTHDHILKVDPDILVTVDSPGFSFRVQKRLKGVSFPKVHYVAPSVWAWKAGRAKKVAAYLDHLLTLLPFEPPYFTAHGLATSFVGHPVVEEPTVPNTIENRRELGLEEGRKTLLVLPGSRAGEVKRLLSIFGETLQNLRERGQDFQVLIPAVSHLKKTIEKDVQAWPMPAVVCEGEINKRRAFAVADAALAASGTVALELAIAGVPTVVAYRVHAVTAFLARRMLKTRFVSLPNILLSKALQPERLQEYCRPAILTNDLMPFLSDPRTINHYKECCEQLRSQLIPEKISPSEKAAKVVLSLIEKQKA